MYCTCATHVVPQAIPVAGKGRLSAMAQRVRALLAGEQECEPVRTGKPLYSRRPLPGLQRLPLLRLTSGSARPPAVPHLPLALARARALPQPLCLRAHSNSAPAEVHSALQWLL